MEKKLLETLKNKTILYAEDDSNIQKLLLNTLSYFTKNILVASDGEEAIKHYENNEIDIAILDIMMPNITGLEVLQHIRQENKNVKVIIISAYSEKSYLLDAIKLKVDGYLIKPFKLEELREILLEFAQDFCENGESLMSINENVQYDVNEHLLYMHKEEVELTKNEGIVIDVLIQNLDKVSTYDMIFSHFDIDEINTKQALATIIMKIKKKVPAITIKSIYNQGYKLLSS